MVTGASFTEKRETRVLVGVHQVKAEKENVSGEGTARANALKEEEDGQTGRMEGCRCGQDGWDRGEWWEGSAARRTVI